MPEVDCSRCGNAAPGLDRPPFPGAEGQAVADRVCAACWKDWLRQQVMLINENRLSPADPDHYAFLLAQMKVFLNLDEE